MKKLFALMMILMLCLAFVGCGNAEDPVAPDAPNACVPSVMYQGVLYRTTGTTLPDAEVDESAIVGEITSVVPLSQWPAKDGEANFGEVGMPYALVSEGLAVRIDNAWYLYAKGYEAG